MKCVLCSKEIKSLAHVKNCAKKQNIVDIEQVMYNQIIYSFPDVDLNKDTLENLYFKLNKNIEEISNEFNIPVKKLMIVINYYKIKIKDIKQRNSSNLKKSKTRATLLKNYGVDNPSKSKEIQKTKKDNWTEKYDGIHWNSTEEVKNKTKKTNLDKYGTEFFFQSDDFKTKNEKTCLKKYGKKHHRIDSQISSYNLLSDEEKILRNTKISNSLKELWKNSTEDEKNLLNSNNKRSDETKEKIKLQASINTKAWWNSLTAEEKSEHIVKIQSYYKYNFSGLEKNIEELLIKNNIKFERQKWINNFCYDFLILEKNILLEAQGDYWHCNPELYLEDYYHTIIKKTSKEIWEYDKVKMENAEKYKYSVIYVWEKDFMKNKDMSFLKLLT